MSIAEKLTTIAENEQKVYDKGVEDGKKSEYDAFWDVQQSNGNRINYNNAFGGVGWSKNNFKPKYNIKVNTGYMMFYFFNDGRTAIDLVDTFANLGISFDTSTAYGLNYLFAYARVSRVGTVDTTGCANVENTFNNCSTLVTIEKLVFKSDGSQTHYTPFSGCTKLANINEIKGKIGRTTTFASCPLTVETAKRVINALMNYSGTANELKYKITLKSTVWDALNETETPPSGDTWQDYVETLGWSCA